MIGTAAKISAGLTSTPHPHRIEIVRSVSVLSRPRATIQMITIRMKAESTSVRRAGSNMTIQTGFHPTATREPAMAAAALPVHRETVVYTKRVARIPRTICDT